MDKNFDDFSSKIKRVFIEIHDFSFFHGPSSSENSDKSFIGRERLLDKFRSIKGCANAYPFLFNKVLTSKYLEVRKKNGELTKN